MRVVAEVPGAQFLNKYVIMEFDSIIAYMLKRRLAPQVRHLLAHSPAVVILGPRQAGKTTLALEVGGKGHSVYLDLEDADDRSKLANPALYLSTHQDELVILDEVERMPNYFSNCAL